MPDTIASAFRDLVTSDTDVIIVPCADDGDPGMENMSYEITLEGGVLMNRISAFDPDSGDIVLQGKTPMQTTPEALRALAAEDGAGVSPAYTYATWTMPEMPRAA